MDLLLRGHFPTPLKRVTEFTEVVISEFWDDILTQLTRFQGIIVYRADGVDGPQEMEKK